MEDKTKKFAERLLAELWLRAGKETDPAIAAAAYLVAAALSDTIVSEWRKDVR